MAIISNISGTLTPENTVEIVGEGFGDTQGAAEVLIEDVVQPVLNWTDTTIEIEVDRGDCQYNQEVPLCVAMPEEEETVEEMVSLEPPESFSPTIGNGNTIAFRRLSDFNETQGQYNTRAIAYWWKMGATSSQYNLARKQAIALNS